jgi:hypothetical protein
MLRTVVNEIRDFGLPHSRGAIAENKKKRIDEIRFAGSIGTNNARELGMEVTDRAMPVKALEIVEIHAREDQAGVHRMTV